MSDPDARNFTNNLPSLSLDEKSLQETLSQFQSAITTSLNLIEQNNSADGSNQHDNLYTGNSGIALMYLRLSQQTPTSSPPVGKLLELVEAHRSHLYFHKLPTSRLSPIGSPVGPAVVELSRQLVMVRKNDMQHTELWEAATSTLQQAVSVALDLESVEDGPGATEVLYGRAGLLWAILNLRQLLGSADTEMAKMPHLRSLSTFIDSQVVRELVDGLISAGKKGKIKFEKQYGEDGMPLMWEWHDKFYLGAIHGAAGILAIILQAPVDIVSPHLPVILSTIKDLVQITLKFTGHLPSSLPARQRSHPHVQICHGSPGLLLLLATLKSCFPDHWDESQFARGMEMAAETVWQEGLVRKGLGLCHGVTGNAWPLLLLGDDKNLSRALQFLLHATRLPPLCDEEELPYRTPDHPWSLFEGLAGAVCAWSEACVIIEERLGKSTKTKVLGIPGLGGLGVRGVL